MTNWSIDIVRQAGWDLWLAVCVAAALVLVCYAVFARLWSRPRGWVALLLIAGAVPGTFAIVVTPALRSPFVGLVWTFTLLCILSAVFYINLMDRLGPRRTAALLTMRAAALLLLVPMLFEPVIRYVARPKPERPLLFLIDTSGSMSIPDVQNGPTRIQSVWQTLRPQLPKLHDHFLPRLFTFDSELRPLDAAEALATMPAEGASTDITGSVLAALMQSRHPQSAVVLISDGIDNVSPDVVNPLKVAGRKVHTVRVGSEQAEPSMITNLAVERIDAPADLVVGNEGIVRATIRSWGLANRVVDVKLAAIDEAGAATSEPAMHKLVLEPAAGGQEVELPYTPRQVGVHRLAVWVDPVPGERSIADNRQEFQVLAIDPRIRVLYIEGRARPEYRELNRALGRDGNIEVASLLRIQEDRFAASGTAEGRRLAGLPRDPDEWRRFDVIILGDLDSSFLSAAQQSAIEQRVSEGAALLMIGGQNSFGPGGYHGSPIERALPVFVGGLDAAQEKSQFVPRLTEEGHMHPAMEGLGEWFGAAETREQADAATGGSGQLPPLRGNVIVQGPKSGAQVLLAHHDRPGPDGNPQIVLAVQQYGKGRSAAFTADTTYLWYLPLRGMGQDSPYNRLWGQLVRWLAGEDVRHRDLGPGVEALLDKSLYTIGESVRVRAMVRDERGDVTRYAQVALLLKRADEEPRQFPLSPSEVRTGLYDVTIPTPHVGEYEAEVVAVKDGVELGRQSLSFTVTAPVDEMLILAANAALLMSIAEQTGGFHYPLPQLGVLIDELIRRDPGAIGARQETIPLANTVRSLLALAGADPRWPARYDLPMQGVLVVSLLAGEWMMRRRWQLP